MKVAFLGNSFHLTKTKSTDFLIDCLRDWFGDVTVIAHKDAWAKLPGTKWDLIVTFQKMWEATELEAFGAERTVLVPMFDDCPKDRTSWEPYQGFRILSFSSTLGADLEAWGHDVMTVQYWQSAPEQPVDDFSGFRGFFWPRTRALTWNHVRNLAAGTPWASFHLHVTNEDGAIVLPTEEDRDRFHLEQTTWFESSEVAKAMVTRANVYFAPRTAEGIGQAVLEALALGQCVVAPNAPTMNEYIHHGLNGLLYDPEKPDQLDLSRAEEMGRCARESVIEGRARWEASGPAVRDFLMAPPRPRPRKFHPWIIMKGRCIAFLRAGFRIFKKALRRD